MAKDDLDQSLLGLEHKSGVYCVQKSLVDTSRYGRAKESDLREKNEARMEKFACWTLGVHIPRSEVIRVLSFCYKYMRKAVDKKASKASQERKKMCQI